MSQLPVETTGTGQTTEKPMGRAGKKGGLKPCCMRVARKEEIFFKLARAVQDKQRVNYRKEIKDVSPTPISAKCHLSGQATRAGEECARLRHTWSESPFTFDLAETAHRILRSWRPRDIIQSTIAQNLLRTQERTNRALARYDLFFRPPVRGLSPSRNPIITGEMSPRGA